MSTIDKFLQNIFPAFPDDTAIPIWDRKADEGPGFPRGWKAGRSYNAANAHYFGTSSLKPDAEGRIRNRIKNFAALHVVVLDDIGTKVDPDSLPDAFKRPSYIIKTSPGNYQYGLVLEKPIADYDHAKALVDIVYQSGYTDAGGALVTKLVRLPYGVNGKNQNADFEVKLEQSDFRKYTPTQILDACGSKVSFEDITKDTTTARRRGMPDNTSEWGATLPKLLGFEGKVDPVLEWLEETGRVEDMNQEWVTIQCPWHEGHTDQHKTAGYSPLGWGDDASILSRGFHCFHEHCKDKHSTEFLEWVVENGGPTGLPTQQTDTDLIGTMVWCSDGYGIMLDTGRQVHARNIPQTFRKPVFIPGRKGAVPEGKAWLENPNVPVVFGLTSDPLTPARIVDQGGTPLYNLFREPPWSRIDMENNERFKANVDKFLDFIEYLIPNEDEAAYFIEWLAAKVQNRGFRGCGIVMVTSSFGTGRTFLFTLLEQMFTPRNCATISFESLVGGREFNEAQDKLLVFCDETQDLGTSTTQLAFKRSYERLKELVDPRAKHITINPKYGKKYDVTSYTSYIMASNHPQAVAMPDADRRFYVISNAEVPRDAEYFESMQQWANAKHTVEDLWNFLSRSVKPDLTMLNSPAPKTRAKASMVDATRSPIHRAIEAGLDKWNSPYLYLGWWKQEMRSHALEMGIEKTSYMDQIVETYLRNISDVPPQASGGHAATFNGKVRRFRHLKGRTVKFEDPTRYRSDHLQSCMERVNFRKVQEAISDTIEE